MIAEEVAFMFVVTVAVWAASRAAAIFFYRVLFKDQPPCESRTVLILPFILIGDVLTTISRKRTARLIRRAAP